MTLPPPPPWSIQTTYIETWLVRRTSWPLNCSVTQEVIYWSRGCKRMEGCRKETRRCKTRKFNVGGMRSSGFTAKWLVKVIQMYRFNCNLLSRVLYFLASKSWCRCKGISHVFLTFQWRLISMKMWIFTTFKDYCIFITFIFLFATIENVMFLYTLFIL